MNPFIQAAIRRFPLIGRPRPICPAIELRIQEVLDAVTAAEQVTEDRMHHAAHALNKAALIASDARMADFARDVCWQHIDVYRNLGRPLTFIECRYMLEPVHNLARLKIRANHGTTALTLLEEMYQAVTTRTDLAVEGQVLPVGELVGNRGDEQALRRWVWLQLVGDGVRALALANRWPKAAEHAQDHNGIGNHLLEGRQAAIIADLIAGRSSEAMERLTSTALTEPWEHEVMSCLRVMCISQEAVEQQLRLAFRRMRTSNQDPQYASYRTRLGLTIMVLAKGICPELAEEARISTVGDAIRSADGYAARDVLNCGGISDALAGHERTQLAQISTGSGLGVSLESASLRQVMQASRDAKKMLAAAM
ncbi:hypothetical protein AB0C07_09755 [Actinoplanes missouriensis]|uniref:hypothetical protein n=1 Tax=Actinoplanes missouriensis TaxID=1866 RepID=UPI0033F2702E